MGSKNLVPRNSGEGGLGTSSKPWGSGYYDNLYVTGAAGAFVKVQGGGGGGSTSPGGSNTQIQFNNAGSFGGSSDLTWNGSTLNVQGGITGNSISGTTGTFLRRPSVNGSGVLLQGEATSASAGGSNLEIQYNSDGSFGGLGIIYDSGYAPNGLSTETLKSGALVFSGESIAHIISSGNGIEAETNFGLIFHTIDHPSDDTQTVQGVILGKLDKDGGWSAEGVENNSHSVISADVYNNFVGVNLPPMRGQDYSNYFSPYEFIVMRDTFAGGIPSSNDYGKVKVGELNAEEGITGSAISGTTGTFLQRPSVNGSGVLLQGEATSASAGGNDTEVQYNDGGSFSGSSNFTWNNTSSTLSVVGSVSGQNVSGSYISGSTGAFSSISGDLIPTTSGTQNLGSPEKPWSGLYIESNSIYFNGEKLSVESDQLKLNDKPVASDFSIRLVDSTDVDTTLISDHLNQVHVNSSVTVTLPSGNEFTNFKTTYTSLTSDIYIGFEVENDGVTLEGKATGINGQWDWANVYRGAGGWYIEGNNLKNASNNPSITDFSTDTITNTSIQVSITSDQTVSGYVTGVPNGSTAPTSNQLKASSFYNTNINTGPVNINITSLDIGTAYDLYAIVLNSAEEESSISSILNVSTDSGPTITSFIKFGDSTESAITTRITSDEVGTGYILATGDGDPKPNASQIKSNPNTQSFEISSAGTPVTRTITSLNSSTDYQIVGYVEDNEGAGSLVSGISASTLAPTNLITDGLMVRLFGWDDDNYTNNQDLIEDASINPGDGVTGTHDVYRSTYALPGGEYVSGVLTNVVNPSPGANEYVQSISDSQSPSVTKKAIELKGFVGSVNDFISMPQLQDNSNGEWNSDLQFLQNNSADDPSDCGFTISMWLMPSQNLESPERFVMPFGIGASGDNLDNKVALINDFVGTDRPALIRGADDNDQIYAPDRDDPPNPWDKLYSTNDWSFISIMYNGSQISTIPLSSSKAPTTAVSIAVGTGDPSDPSKRGMFFYSGDGLTAGYEHLEVRGANLAGRGTAGNSWLDLQDTNNFLATIGYPKGQASDYYPGYFSDFRIYNRPLSTGECFSIFTGDGNY